MDKSNCYEYTLWAYGIVNGGFKEWEKKIYRKNRITKERKESLIESYACGLVDRYNANIYLCGCNIEVPSSCRECKFFKQESKYWCAKDSKCSDEHSEWLNQNYAGGRPNWCSIKE